MPRHSKFQLISAGRLIDGLDDKPIVNGAVLTKDSQILQVGKSSEVTAPEGANVQKLDFPSGTLMPGLVDVHCHFNYIGDGTHTDDVMELSDEILMMRSMKTALTHLESGVTTARETGAKHQTSIYLREAIRSGLTKGPRLVVSGNPITITGGHMWQMGSEADGEDGVRKAVRSLIKRGTDWIKVAATGGTTRTSIRFRPSFTVGELRALTDEAHNFGLLVGTHCSVTAGIVNSLDAGVDMIIHCRFQEPDGSMKFRPDIAERIARDGRVVNTTLHTGRSKIWMLEEVSRQTDKEQAVAYGDEMIDLDTMKAGYARVLDQARLLNEIGVTLIPGTDSGFGWFPFGGFGHELECLTEIGYSPMRAIQAATRQASKAIGVSEMVGTLETGKLADLLVVEGDPTSDIRAVQVVKAVFQSGERVR